MITDSPGLDRFLDAAQAVDRLALDTEADSLHCYFEKLCLIQIAMPGYAELLDPLANVDLKKFFAGLATKEVVFHGADYDLRLLYRQGDFAPARIFDTMLAARLCGEEQVGLAALVQKFFSIELSKASQKANWGQRPLSQQMIHYALNDVRHLLDLAEILRQRLEELGRLSWLEEWIERVAQSARNPREKDPDQLWRIAGAAKLAPREQAVLRSLWHWRDAEARAWDRPPFFVMSNSDLLRIAEKAVAGEPFSTPRFPRSRRERFEANLQHALSIPPNAWPQRPKHVRPKGNPDFGRNFDRLKSRRDAVARELQLEPSIIAPKAALEQIAGNGDTSILMRWQRELLQLPLEVPQANAA